MLHAAPRAGAPMTPQPPHHLSHPSLWSLMAGFARHHARAYSLSAVMLMGVALLSVWIPRQVGHIIDALVADPTHAQSSALWRQAGVLLAMGALIYVLRVGWRLQLFSAAYRLGVELRARLVQRLLVLGPQFFNAHKTGDLMARATNDVDAIEMAAGDAFLAAFDGTLTLVLVVAMMTLGIDWRLALVALLPFPFMAGAFWLISRRVHDAWRESLERFSRLNEQVQETVAGVRTLRALGLEERASHDFAQRTRAAAESGFEAQRWESAYEPAVGLTLTLATVLTLSLGGWFVWHAQMSVGELAAFSMYLGQLIWPMFAAGWVLSLMERARAAWGRLGPLLDAPVLMQDHGRLTEPPTGPITFDRVSFTYPASDVRVLHDLSFEVEPGQTLGIVGPTGSGKSTVLYLLLRHYEAEAGDIRWGEHAVADYTLASLRGAMAWVPQEPFLFGASIAQNIALADPAATRAQIEHAAQCAALHDDVMRLPQSYDTVVGERGVTLSGGQRQRVAIARALLQPHPLLLLDDALSAVDAGTQMNILDKLRTGGQQQGQGQRTTVIVSHRLSAVMEADQILVLKAGRIVERGAHAELLHMNGWYAEQWRYQQLEASLEH